MNFFSLYIPHRIVIHFDITFCIDDKLCNIAFLSFKKKINKNGKNVQEMILNMLSNMVSQITEQPGWHESKSREYETQWNTMDLTQNKIYISYSFIHIYYNSIIYEHSININRQQLRRTGLFYLRHLFSCWQFLPP